MNTTYTSFNSLPYFLLLNNNYQNQYNAEPFNFVNIQPKQFICEVCNRFIDTNQLWNRNCVVPMCQNCIDKMYKTEKHQPCFKYVNENNEIIKPVPIRNENSNENKQLISFDTSGLEILSKIASETDKKGKKRHITPASQFLVCATCNQTKPYKEFTTKRTGERTRTCKMCSERKKSYYQRHLSRKRKYQYDTFYF